MMNTMMEETLLTGTARKAELPGCRRPARPRTQPGLARRLVRWLHQPSRHRRLARQRRQFADAKASGGNLPVEIWSRFMKTAHQGVPVAGLPSGAWRAAEPEPARLADSVLNLFGAGPAAPPPPRVEPQSRAASFSRGVSGRRRRTKPERPVHGLEALLPPRIFRRRNETRGKKSAARGEEKNFLRSCLGVKWGHHENGMSMNQADRVKILMKGFRWRRHSDRIRRD